MFIFKRVVSNKWHSLPVPAKNKGLQKCRSFFCLLCDLIEKSKLALVSGLPRLWCRAILTDCASLNQYHGLFMPAPVRHTNQVI